MKPAQGVRVNVNGFPNHTVAHRVTDEPFLPANAATAAVSELSPPAHQRETFPQAVRNA